jgi:hypothetical protein
VAVAVVAAAAGVPAALLQVALAGLGVVDSVEQPCQVELQSVELDLQADWRAEPVAVLPELYRKSSKVWRQSVLRGVRDLQMQTVPDSRQPIAHSEPVPAMRSCADRAWPRFLSRWGGHSGRHGHRYN